MGFEEFASFTDSSSEVVRDGEQEVIANVSGAAGSSDVHRGSNCSEAEVALVCHSEPVCVRWPPRLCGGPGFLANTAPWVGSVPLRAGAFELVRVLRPRSGSRARGFGEEAPEGVG